MSASVSQRSKIDHFKAVTNIDNDDIAQIALQKCNWDVNVCITRYFDNPDALLSSQRNPNQSNEQQQRPHPHPHPIQQSQQAQQSSIQYYASYIPGLTTFGSLISSMFGYITPYLPYFSSILSMFGTASSSVPYSQILNEFKTKHRKFGNEYNDNTIFRNIRFGQLMNENDENQENDKCLFIFFNDSSSTICNRFITNILSDDDVLNYLRINMKCWIGDSRNNDGKQLFRQITHQFNAPKRKPFICIAGIHPISRKLVLVHREYVGNITSSILFIANILDHGLQRWQTFKLQQIQRQQLSASNRSLRELQDLEYQRVLQQQQTLQQQQQQETIEDDDIFEDEETLNQIEQDRIKQKYENRMKIAKEKINKLLKLNENISKDKLIKVALKLPNNKRVQNIFCNDNKIESLFDFALCHELLIDDKQIDDFEIICNFPKVTFNKKDYDKTFKEFGIEHSAIMHISSLD